MPIPRIRAEINVPDLIRRCAEASTNDLPDLLHAIETFRAMHPDSGLDAGFIQAINKSHRALLEMQEGINKLTDTVNSLTDEPWHTATFLHPVIRGDRTRAKVLCGNRDLVVGVGNDVNLSAIKAGDEVYLNREDSIVAPGDRLTPPGGHIGSVERLLPDGRLLVNVRDERKIVEPLGDAIEAEPGDLLRVDQERHLAFERIEPPATSTSLVRDLPDVHRGDLAGQTENYDRLKMALAAALINPEVADLYQVTGRNNGILLWGPPGCGKTLSVQVAARELAEEHGVKVKFASIKPGSWESPWYGQTGENIRRDFEVFRRLADEGTHVIVYIDEVESVSRHRGTGIGHADDKQVATLLSELDGFTQRRGVVVICSTNRKDLIDSALLDRISGTEICISRPNATAARDIFAAHMPASLPFFPNGDSAPATRRELIEVAVSRLYAPNGGGKVAVVKFTDGKQREIKARELVSGRLIFSICANARHLAFARDVKAGDRGIRVQDMEQAVDIALQKMATTITRHNVHSWITDLSQDAQVLAVEATPTAARTTGRYLNQPQHPAAA